MLVTYSKKPSTQIEDLVVKDILLFYPEEELIERRIFKAAFLNGHIEFKDLQSECSKLLIPWQMFFLNSKNYRIQRAHIEEQRMDKVSNKLLSKRSGKGNITSRRIIDRLIRQQNYIVGAGKFKPNVLCGCIKNLSITNAANKLIKSISIDQSIFWNYKSKSTALEYLLHKVDLANINVSRGVLTNKILPNHRVVHSKVYKNTSGFVIKDEYVPFIFIPSEINPDEVESRQIYTLIYLLVIIGLDQYDYFLDKDFNSKILKAKGISKLLHSITTEILIPRTEIKKINVEHITKEELDQLSNKLKVSTLALTTTLLIRKVINKVQFEELKPLPFQFNKIVRPMRTPKVSTSVEKFCGPQSFRTINAAIKSKILKRSQAQYLIFGSINKKGYFKYCAELGL